MSHPLLYEINTRCWLRELSARLGTRIHLANVPEAEFARWQRLGFTHLWLMGVWSTGPRSRAASRHSPEVRASAMELLPDFREEDIAGSPYAIASYTVARSLGGASALQAFRRKLASYGLKLVLDFVPNHTGLDHPWLAKRPGLFVAGAAGADGTFVQETDAGPRRLAHGRDPFFPAWRDTAQLDYRSPATRAAMLETLQSIAQQCDGVRCDMAMLVLNDVFAKTWEAFPGGSGSPNTEFWTDAIGAVKESSPEFLFLAEAYWDLEARLQEVGFDFTYDKKLYDHLLARRSTEASRHLLTLGPPFLEASAHFIENHDERRVATALSWSEHRAAGLVVAGLPGLRFFHEGQLTGARRHVSVHLGRRPAEDPQPAITAWYEYLLTALGVSAVGRGQGRLLTPHPAWPGNPTAANFVLVQWQAGPESFDLVVVNLAPHDSQCYAPLTVAGLAGRNWNLKNMLGTEVYERAGDDLQQSGLYLDVPGHGAQLLHFEPVN